MIKYKVFFLLLWVANGLFLENGFKLSPKKINRKFIEDNRKLIDIKSIEPLKKSITLAQSRQSRQSSQSSSDSFSSFKDFKEKAAFDAAKNHVVSFPSSPRFGMCNLKDFVWREEDQLGRGGFGQVYKAVHKPTGQVVALKFVSAGSIRKNSSHVINEENIHSRLRNNVLYTEHYCTTKTETNDVVFVMEYVPGKNLGKRIPEIRDLPRKKLQLMVAELVLALEYLHSLGIVYRDMKAENVLITETGHIKVTDFGLSKFGPQRSVAGTIEYMAPEIAQHREYDQAVDYYALGVLLYYISMGKLPMTRKQLKNDKQKFLKLIAKGLHFEKLSDPQLDDLVRHLVETDTSKRWGKSPETRKLLKNHPYFAGIDWKDLESRTIRPDDHTLYYK